MNYKKYVPQIGDFITGRNYSSGNIRGRYLGWNYKGIICMTDSGQKRFLKFINSPYKQEIPFEVFISWRLDPIPDYKYKSQCGIYIFYNHQTKTAYVGQSKSLDRRRTTFYLHGRRYAGESINKARDEFPDFIKVWSYRVLQYCTEKELKTLERDWLIRCIVKWKKTYNEIT